jgi:hypothetical protein
MFLDIQKQIVSRRQSSCSAKGLFIVFFLTRSWLGARVSVPITYSAVYQNQKLEDKEC